MSEESLSRIYIIPLSRAWLAPRRRRAKRAINMIREFVERHMKTSEVRIDEKLNEYVWSRGIEKPPKRVVVRVEKDREGVATVFLAEEESS